MANGTDSIERIAADILIASLSQTGAGTAAAMIDKPDQITAAYKEIHETVKNAFDKRQDF